MDQRELELHAELLERKFETSRPSERNKLRPGIERLIRALRASDHPIPKPLRRLGDKLEQESADDLFDNLPV